MKYEITIKKAREVTDEKSSYVPLDEIYQQTVEDMDIEAVIKAANKFT